MSDIDFVGNLTNLEDGLIFPSREQLERVARALKINIPIRVQLTDNRRELAMAEEGYVPHSLMLATGCYHSRKQIIYIYPVIESSKDEISQRFYGGYGLITLCHEYGHYLYWTRIKEKRLWIDWMELFARNTDKPTDYAKTNVDECFAECFVNYCYGLKLDNQFKEFFDTNFREYKGCLFKELRFDLLK